jgi:uncharacterized lipoprotein YddW (UPF0748 family)
MKFLLSFTALSLISSMQASLAADAEQIRGLWVDAWHPGFKTEAEVQRLVKDARAANLNAIFAQVRRRADAFYESSLVPRPSDTNIVPADFDSLRALLQAAHDTSKGPRLEVHAWLVVYPATSLVKPGDPAHVFNSHPDWLSQTHLGAQFDGVDKGH